MDEYNELFRLANASENAELLRANRDVAAVERLLQAIEVHRSKPAVSLPATNSLSEIIERVDQKLRAVSNFNFAF
jgi:hypothetical protein